MSSYDWYLLVRSIEGVLDRVGGVLIILAVGGIGLAGFRMWLKRKYGPDNRVLGKKLETLETRIARVENDLGKINEAGDDTSRAERFTEKQ
jgi:hypothetical protein